MTEQSQLHMLWPLKRLNDPPKVVLPAGYLLRQFRETERAAYFQLMINAGFTNANDAWLDEWFPKVLPQGFFVIEHLADGTLVASTVATHCPEALHPFGGELGWVAGDAAHHGRGLGVAISAAATARLLRAGYENIYLKTDDWRLPAIKCYLKVGYEPYLFHPAMDERWQVICDQLAWPFTPDNWPKAPAINPLTPP